MWGYSEDKLYILRYESFESARAPGKYHSRWYCMVGDKGVDILNYNIKHKRISLIDILNVVNRGVNAYIKLPLIVYRLFGASGDYDTVYYIPELNITLKAGVISGHIVKNLVKLHSGDLQNRDASEDGIMPWGMIYTGGRSHVKISGDSYRVVDAYPANEIRLEEHLLNVCTPLPVCAYGKPYSPFYCLFYSRVSA